MPMVIDAYYNNVADELLHVNPNENMKHKIGRSLINLLTVRIKIFKHYLQAIG